MITKIRSIVQFVLLGIFMSLMILGKAQIWMGFIFISILLATFFGRYYCGWACPINTLMKPINWMKKKLGIKRENVPQIFKSEKIRSVIFVIFLLGLGYTMYTIKMGKKFPLPLIIIPMGLVTTLVFNEKTWHRYLCPWGVLFSLTGRFAKLKIMANTCHSCSVCEKNCPADAIVIDKNKGAVVDSTHCLICFECTSKCPINTMKYKSIYQEKRE